MTIKEYIDSKEKLRNNISNLIKEYEQKCNVIIEKIDIKHDNENQIGLKIKDEFKI